MVSNTHPRTPWAVPLAGHLFSYYRDPLGFLTKLARREGDVARFKIGPHTAYLLNRPDYIRQVLARGENALVRAEPFHQLRRLLGDGLLTTDGDVHREHRRLVQPVFQRQRMAAYGDVIVECAGQMRERWQDGASVSLVEEMAALTRRAIAKALLGVDLETDAQELGAAVENSLATFRPDMLPGSPQACIPFLGELLSRRARKRLDKAVYLLLKEPGAGGEDGRNLLSTLVAAHSSGLVSARQVRDEVVTFVMSGHETVASALVWTWYLLARHPRVETELHDELDRVLAGRSPTVEDMPRLRYTRMVFAEALRICPPVWAVSRRALRAHSIGPYTIEPGSILFLSQFVTQRDPRYFPDPLLFLPERWASTGSAESIESLYFPFWLGLHRCIGETFAWMEGVLVITTLAQSWRIHPASESRIVLEAGLTLRPKHGLRVRLQQRTA